MSRLFFCLLLVGGVRKALPTESPTSPTDECSFDSFDCAGDDEGGGMFADKDGDGDGGAPPGGDGDTEEIRRVDEEIESKVGKRKSRRVIRVSVRRWERWKS